MKLFFLKFVAFFFLASCSNINFLLESNKQSNLLKNKTSIYVDGWENPILKEVFFLEFGEPLNEQFLLSAKVKETQTKRSVNENQVAQKIDYKITIHYVLVDVSKKCPDIEKVHTSSFSFAPKSSGHNFASDVLLKSLFEEAISSNLIAFMSFAENKIRVYDCLNEN